MINANPTGKYPIFKLNVQRLAVRFKSITVYSYILVSFWSQMDSNSLSFALSHLSSFFDNTRRKKLTRLPHLIPPSLTKKVHQSRVR